MKDKPSKGYFLMILTIITLSSYNFSTLIQAADENVGVEPGDWIEYEVQGLWNETESKPSIFEAVWLKMEVQTIDISQVTVLFTSKYEDGSEEANTLSWNIDNYREIWIIPAGLEKGSMIPGLFGAEYDTINDTSSRLVAGTFRQVNLVQVTGYSDIYEVESTLYWDKETGVLVESYLHRISPTGTATLVYKALDTNMWSPIPISVTTHLSSEIVTLGDTITITVEVRDEQENPIEAAKVTAILGSKSVELQDLGDGNYQGLIDVLDLPKGDNEIKVFVEKEGYQKTESVKSVFIEVPATFTIQNLMINPSSIDKGGTVTISVDISNIGGRAGTHTITLTLNGLLKEESSITLDPDMTETISFEILGEEEGMYSVDVNGIVGSFEVISPAIFTISELYINPSSIKKGEKVTISVEVSNTGGRFGDFDVELKINDVVEDVEVVSLDPGEHRTVSFQLTAKDEGTHSVGVNGLMGEYTVTKPSFIEQIPGFAYESIILGLIGATMILWLFQRNK